MPKQRWAELQWVWDKVDNTRFTLLHKKASGGDLSQKEEAVLEFLQEVFEGLASLEKPTAYQGEVRRAVEAGRRAIEAAKKEQEQ